MFFSKLSEELEKRGHRVFRTTRRYREVQHLLKLKGVDAKVVGEHGGKELIGKLKASAQRTLELASVFEEIEPDVAVSFSSPEMARVSYGLKVPHICVNDSPHAEAVARLTVPLSERLLTPRIIPKRSWTKYGIPSEKIVQYDALDPWVWLKDFKPDERILKKLGLDESKPILTFRTEETFAAYLLGKTQKEMTIIPIIEKILEEKKALQIVAVPRYKEQIKALHEVFKDRIAICELVVDGPSLLNYSSVFVGAGGTMSAEAALLGVPTFSCYPGEPFLVERYLIRKKLVTRETDPDKRVNRILATLSNVDSERKRQSAKVQRLVRNFEDPIEIVTGEVEKFA
jgi:predicted glycosyltransferase